MGNQKGFSVVEVMVSMILFAFLAVFVLTFFTGNLDSIRKSTDTTNTLFAAQNNLERASKEITDLLVERQDISNKLVASPGDSFLLTEAARLDTELTALIAATPEASKKTRKLFGVDVDYFAFVSEQKDAAGATLIRLNTSLADMRQAVPIIPEISSIEVSVGTTKQVVYFAAAGAEARSTIVYASSLGRDKEIYQWYDGLPKYHTEAVVGEQLEVTGNHPAFYYPSGVGILSSEQGTELKDVHNYKGQSILCTVVPVSKLGVYGKTAVSNSIYISALPKLSTNGYYAMLLDPSFITRTAPLLPVPPPAKPTFTQFYTQNPSGRANIPMVTSSGSSHIVLAGANTSNHATATSYSRYIGCYNQTTNVQAPLTAGNLFIGNIPTKIAVFGVVRSANGIAGNVVTAKPGGTPSVPTPAYLDLKLAGSVNTITYPLLTPEALAASRWTIVANTNVNKNENVLMIGSDPGGMNTDVAEMVVACNTTAAEDAEIIEYLQNKYFIQ